MKRKVIMRFVTIGVALLLTGATAINTADKLLIESLTVDSSGGLFERYINFRELSAPMIPPFVMYDDVADRMSKGDWSFLNENWFSTFDDGVLYVPEKSALAEGLALPARIQVREDMENGLIYILSAPLTDGKPGSFTGLAAVSSPEFMTYDKDFPLDIFLADEFAPRRVVWEITLKPETDAWGDLLFQPEEVSSSKQLEGGGMMSMMMVPEEHANDLWLCLEPQTNGEMNLKVFAPEGFTNRVEIYSCTNLASNVWSIAAQNLYPSDTNPAVTNVTAMGHRFFVAGKMDIDFDSDGICDAREIYIYKTRPDKSDSDGDFIPDEWEINNGLDPSNSSDQMGDPDHDMLPNIYEKFRGTNPQTNDSYLITKIRVDPANADSSNTYSSIKQALAASDAYSVIEVAEGLYTGSTNTGLFFPDHPVMLMSDNWGTSRTTIVKYDADFYEHAPAAFILDKAQDNRTIIRGLTLEMEGDKRFQVGFWVGNGKPLAGPGAAPFFDGVTVELGTSTINIGYFCRHAHPDTVTFNNCVFRGKQGSEVPLRGIYAVDSPSIKIINCTFQDFPSQPYSYGVQLESTSMNYGEAVNPVSVEIANSVWDESFAASNTECFVKRENGVEYNVHVSDSIMPAYPDWFPPNYSINLHAANAFLSTGAHQTTNSPGLNLAGTPLTWYDFEGQARGFAPDIGADEYGNYSAGDSDHDGLSDLDEATKYFTDMYAADTDGDSIPDGTEVTDGTSPTNALNYKLTIEGSITNLTATNVAMIACYSRTAGVWNVSASTNVNTAGEFVFEDLLMDTQEGLWVQVYCDFNTNGLPDSNEPFYQQPVIAAGRQYFCQFVVRDCDGDGVDDLNEFRCNTDPNDPANYCVTISGTVSNDTPVTDALGVSLATGPIGQNILITTNVPATNSFRFDHVEVTEAGSLWINLFNDINTNAVHDSNELSIAKMTFVTGAVTEVQMELSLKTCDQDKDQMLDFWEQRNGLDWTDGTDAFDDYPDQDGMYNLHEYWANTGVTVSNSNYAISDAMFAVDKKIAGLNPTNSLHIFNTNCYDTINFIRNTNCWAYSYNLTCISPWNSYSGQWRAGTLITPRHVLFATHFNQIPTNHVLRFIDKQNNIVERTLIGTNAQVQPSGSPYYPDLTIGLLDSDVPTNSIGIAKVLPDNYTSYLGNGERLPILCLDQEEKALIRDIAVISTGEDFPNSRFRPPFDEERVKYYELLLPNDSGNPGFLIINDQLVVLTVWTGGLAGVGSSVAHYKDDLNQMIDDLNEQYGITNSYQLEEINLSSFNFLGD